MQTIDNDALGLLGLAQEQARRRGTHTDNDKTHHLKPSNFTTMHSGGERKRDFTNSPSLCFLNASTFSSFLLSESTGSLSSKYWLSLAPPQVPRYPHARAYFPVKVMMVDSRKQVKTGWNVMIHVELLYENGEMVSDQTKHIEVYGHDESRPIFLGTTGTLDLKIRILTTSMAHDNKPFFIRLSGIPADKNIPSHVSIMPATSNLMTAIRHRLKITESPPNLWYKDEGGRDSTET